MHFQCISNSPPSVRAQTFAMSSLTACSAPISPNTFLEKGLHGLDILRKNGVPEEVCAAKRDEIMERWSTLLAASAASGSASLELSYNSQLRQRTKEIFLLHILFLLFFRCKGFNESEKEKT